LIYNYQNLKQNGVFSQTSGRIGTNLASLKW